MVDPEDMLVLFAIPVSREPCRNRDGFSEPPQIPAGLQCNISCIIEGSSEIPLQSLTPVSRGPDNIHIIHRAGRLQSTGSRR